MKSIFLLKNETFTYFIAKTRIGYAKHVLQTAECKQQYTKLSYLMVNGTIHPNDYTTQLNIQPFPSNQFPLPLMNDSLVITPNKGGAPQLQLRRVFRYVLCTFLRHMCCVPKTRVLCT